MIDVTRERLLDIDEAAALFNRSKKCIYDWMRETDHKGRSKQRVLESVLVGGSRKTSEEALQRFAVQGVRRIPLPPAMSTEQQAQVALSFLQGLGFKV